MGCKDFFEWHEARQNAILNNKRCGLMVLKEPKEWTAGDWNYLLKEFVFEVRKENSESYTASSIKDLFSMLSHYIKYTLKNNINLWTDTEIQEARTALDAAMKNVTKQGKVSGLNASQPIPFDIEMKLWSIGMLGVNHPKNLIFTLIYYIGKHFAIRGGCELHRLKVQNELNLVFQNDEEVLEFVENHDSKTRRGGIKQKATPFRRLEAKHTPNHERCLVCMWTLYMSKRPVNCTIPNLFLSWYRKDDCVKNGKWYQNVPLGRHTLDGIVRSLTDAIPTSANSHFTNQSLRKTCATTLHKAGVERQDIAKVTGHTSQAIERYITLDSEDFSRFNLALHHGGAAEPTEKNENKSILRHTHSQDFVLEGPKQKSMKIKANGDTNVIEFSFE